MWDLLKRRNAKCAACEEELERLNAPLAEGRDVNNLLTAFSIDGRAHYSECSDCRERVEIFFESRAALASLIQNTQVASPWFSSKVMAAINERERALAGTEGVWIAVPRYATRLAWVTALVLLAGTTWIFERQMPRQAPGSANEEFLFGSPAPQPSPDDVLMSMTEKNQ
jgi:hypothetical protein